MTEPQNQEPSAPPPASPPPAGGPPPTGSPPPTGGPPPVNWASTARPETQVPGAAGLVYADVPNRIFALIIDAIILAIVTAIINGVLYGVVGQPFTFDFNTGAAGVNILPLIIGTIVSLLISAAYFTYTWTSMRATVGQRVLGMQVGNYPDGRTLTTEQALRRWAALFVPGAVAQVFFGLSVIGPLLGLLSFLYALYLLWTTAQSPTKRGFHDMFANTVVVKAARSV